MWVLLNTWNYSKFQFNIQLDFVDLEERLSKITDFNKEEVDHEIHKLVEDCSRLGKFGALVSTTLARGLKKWLSNSQKLSAF